jgi:PIN domain nuclease of toxin-antitoxin system
MRLLLDTHTFLWFIDGTVLSSRIRQMIEDTANERVLSVASLWEMSIKVSIGKLSLGLPFASLVETQIEGNLIRLLPIAPTHLDVLAGLPYHHRDPFDRLIIAQAIIENAIILSRDTAFDDYPINRVWRQ